MKYPHLSSPLKWLCHLWPNLCSKVYIWHFVWHYCFVSWIAHQWSMDEYIQPNFPVKKPQQKQKHSIKWNMNSLTTRVAPALYRNPPLNRKQNLLKRKPISRVSKKIWRPTCVFTMDLHCYVIHALTVSVGNISMPFAVLTVSSASKWKTHSTITAAKQLYKNWTPPTQKIFKQINLPLKC